VQVQQIIMAELDQVVVVLETQVALEVLEQLIQEAVVEEEVLQVQDQEQEDLV
tara:strand:- start:36 stop:194 length:159 start_codon:yes stop_codon:yes gene_type:complete